MTELELESSDPLEIIAVQAPINYPLQAQVTTPMVVFVVVLQVLRLVKVRAVPALQCSIWLSLLP